MSEGDDRPCPPTLITIGTFLVDAFDSPPRPINDSIPRISYAHTKYRDAPPTPDSPSSPFRAQKHSIQLPRIPSPISMERRSLDTGLTTPEGSGSTTPQLLFDDPPPDDPIEYLGGGGLYCLIGARFFLPATRLKTLVDRAPGGSDLGEHHQAQAKSYGDMFVWNENEDTRLTRARIHYDGDTRLYQRLVAPPHRKMSDLIDTPLEHGQYMHIAPPFSSEDVAKLQEEIAARTKDRPDTWSPKLVFEPSPPSCHVEQRAWLEKIAPGCHILSPNHEELLSFYGHPKFHYADPMLIETVEDVMMHLLETVGVGNGGKGILAVRCGRTGACIGTKARGLKWFPPYYTGEGEANVRDVTGAGNAFIGGYVAGLTLTDDPYKATLYGTVAASFVLEQIGLPAISPATLSAPERWNGVVPADRIKSLHSRWSAAGLL